jgi:hypothetical protein
MLAEDLEGAVLELHERLCSPAEGCARIYTRGRLSPIRFKARVGRGIPALFSSQGERVVARCQEGRAGSTEEVEHEACCV